MLADRLTEILREPVELDDGGEDLLDHSQHWRRGRTVATPDALLRDADLALYAAKAAGKDRYALFEAGMSADAEDRLDLEADLSAASTGAVLPALPADLRSAEPARWSASRR